MSSGFWAGGPEAYEEGLKQHCDAQLAVLRDRLHQGTTDAQRSNSPGDPSDRKAAPGQDQRNRPSDLLTARASRFGREVGTGAQVSKSLEDGMPFPMRREVWLASAASCVVRKRLETDHGRSYNPSLERNIQPGSLRFSDGTAHFGLFDRRLGDSPMTRGKCCCTAERAADHLKPCCRSGAPAAEPATAQLLPLSCGTQRSAADNRRPSESPRRGHQQRL